MDGVIYFPWVPARDVKAFLPKQDHTNQIQSSHRASYRIYSTPRQFYLILFVNFLQNVQNGACTPRLRGTRIMTERPVLVRQLGESRPRIIADVSSGCPKNVVDVV
jgi:hypothetical protein